MAVALVLGRPRALERLVDRAPHDELAAEDAHRRGHRLAHHRLARAGDEAAQGGAQIVRLGLRMQQPAGQHQRPGRGVDEERFRVAEMARPIGLAELVADQPVDGLGIGDAQQRLGEAEQAPPPPARTARIRAGTRRCRPCRAARGGPRSPDGARSRRSGRGRPAASRRRRGCAPPPRSRRSGSLSRIAARNGEAGGKGAVDTISMTGFLSRAPAIRPDCADISANAGGGARSVMWCVVRERRSPQPGFGAGERAGDPCADGGKSA